MNIEKVACVVLLPPTTNGLDPRGLLDGGQCGSMPPIVTIHREEGSGVRCTLDGKRSHLALWERRGLVLAWAGEPAVQGLLRAWMSVCPGLAFQPQWSMGRLIRFALSCAPLLECDLVLLDANHREYTP